MYNEICNIIRIGIRAMSLCRSDLRARTARGCLISVVLCSLLVPWAGDTWASQDSVDVDLTELSLEDLGATKVTLVSRKSERLSEAAAAIFVITNEDVKRAGCRSIAEALRLAPGLQVARIDNNSWAVTTRGLGGTFANKLLVLIDGRSVYTPLFSGVYWDLQDVLLEDLDRIEVIRGPGATMWGANAVNGIINIITKNASETQGLMLQTGAGSDDEFQAAIRYGGVLGQGNHFRVWAKGYSLGYSDLAVGGVIKDNWDTWRGGARSDWTLSPRTEISLVADAYSTSVGHTYTLPSLTTSTFETWIGDDNKNRGGCALVRWSRHPGKTQDYSIQAYVDYMSRRDAFYGEERTTLDVDFQHRWHSGRLLELTWGLGFRNAHDALESTKYAYVSSGRESRSDQLLSGFLQTELTIMDGNLRITAGSKFERNDYTGYEYQPSMRAAWYPSPVHTFWASMARAVRTPSRAERDATLWMSVVPPLSTQNPTPLPLLATLNGSDQFGSEELLAAELGYRYTPGSNLMIDLTAFRNEYEGIRQFVLGSPIVVGMPPTHAELPMTLGNILSGTTWGYEALIDWRLSRSLSVRSNYSRLEIDFPRDESGGSTKVAESAGASPNHQIQIGFSYAVSQRMTVSMNSRHVGELPDLDIESYWAADATVAYAVTNHWELNGVAENLGNASHREYNSEFADAHTLREPRVYLSSTWRF